MDVHTGPLEGLKIPGGESIHVVVGIIEIGLTDLPKSGGGWGQSPRLPSSDGPDTKNSPIAFPRLSIFRFESRTCIA